VAADVQQLTAAHEGRVLAFDAHRGLGVVEDRDGTHYDFHCTRITGGSRSIRVGSAVRYDVVPGTLGRWEADAIAAVAPA
jgi:cold shock CspA family protein